MNDDDFVRATILADQVRDLELKLSAHEGIEDMKADERLKMATAMAYREGISESQIRAIVEAKLAELEGRAVDGVAQCKACQHCDREGAPPDAFGRCVKLDGLVMSGNDGAGCQAFVRVAPGARKIGMKGSAHGTGRAKAGR